MKRFIAALLVLFAASAFGQSYPSPTYNNLTVQGTATLTNHPLAVSSGGTNAAAAGGTALDNVSGFSGTGFLTRTGAGAYAFQSLTNGITYANLAKAGANTMLGNFTGATANVAAFSVPSCSTANSALQYTSASGLSCGTTFALTSGTLAQFASTTSAQLAGIIPDETGSGSLVFASSPALAGTPTAPTATVGTNTTQIATTAFVQTAAGTGRLLNVQVFTSSGTYTPTAGASSAVIECVGGGGGGGGVGATSSTQVAVSGGGGSGAFGRARATSLSSQTVTIGAAGGGGAAGANAGSAGGQTSIGTWLVCPGGAGGPAGTAQTLTNAQALAGTAAGGAIATTSVTSIFLSRGSPSTFGISVYNTGGGVSGGGASSIFGGGGQASSGAATNASGFGAGGGGAANNISSSALGGGSGTAGLIIVYEFS
ncbi:hypothetical protein B0G75_104272 [Paraburkholderia sp. BL18I3N2]|uniref:glycine-rich domain-containing protein n=1 Tax=Paraburkholderia sp. BL18I3N2 TaxID=1938799 RepID=UPI000D4E3CA6|nr:hypothetical protein [Paraburkholderia sp. BL18I3N2]PRX32251.1 hypothetical protein B0G75_104272 [Paraburkholderia sp. BL18I3N2]